MSGPCRAVTGVSPHGRGAGRGFPGRGSGQHCNNSLRPPSPAQPSLCPLRRKLRQPRYPAVGRGRARQRGVATGGLESTPTRLAPVGQFQATSARASASALTMSPSSLRAIPRRCRLPARWLQHILRLGDSWISARRGRWPVHSRRPSPTRARRLIKAVTLLWLPASRLRQASILRLSLVGFCDIDTSLRYSATASDGLFAHHSTVPLIVLARSSRASCVAPGSLQQRLLSGSPHDSIPRVLCSSDPLVRTFVFQPGRRRSSRVARGAAYPSCSTSCSSVPRFKQRFS